MPACPVSQATASQIGGGFGWLPRNGRFGHSLGAWLVLATRMSSLTFSIPHRPPHLCRIPPLKLNAPTSIPSPCSHFSSSHSASCRCLLAPPTAPAAASVVRGKKHGPHSGRETGGIHSIPSSTEADPFHSKLNRGRSPLRAPRQRRPQRVGQDHFLRRRDPLRLRLHLPGFHPHGPTAFASKQFGRPYSLSTAVFLA
jgi:hypothetical protein